MKIKSLSILRHRCAVAISLASLSACAGVAGAVTRFDLNAPGSQTQAGWTAADLGVGSDGTVSITTVAIGAVTLDSRDRTGTASDAGGGGEAAMWNDFLFANGSFSSVPGSGLQITISGLAPDTRFPISIWAFDDASNVGLDGFSRAADWSDGLGGGGVLTFPDGPDPSTLTDYQLVFTSRSDGDGVIVLTGLVAAENPSSSHNVFINGLEIGDALFDSDMDGLADSVEQRIIDADALDAIQTLEDVLPGDDFDMDFSTNLAEAERGTDPIDPDSDDDGLLDGHEDASGGWAGSAATGTDPLVPDSDDDGLLDGVENPDLPYDPANPATQPGSDPNLPDSDGDGIRDGQEVADGTDPTNAEDFLDPLDQAVAKFDFNAPGSPTQSGWTAADAGVGSDGTVGVLTEAIGGLSVDTRDRPAINTDTGDLDHNDLWRDFVFANGSFDSAPGSGLRITLTGLAASTIYPITIWAFDESSNNGRAADWGAAGEPAQVTLTFPSAPDPASLDDYQVTFEVSTDASGVAVIEGLVAAVGPSTSHNVFVNALAVGQPTGSTAIRITAIDLHPEGGDSSITWTSTPGKVYAIDLSTDLQSWPGDLDDGVLAAEDAEETSYTLDASGLGPRAFFRVREIP